MGGATAVLELISAAQVGLGLLLGALFFVPWSQRRGPVAAIIAGGVVMVLAASELLSLEDAPALVRLSVFVALGFLWVIVCFRGGVIHAVFVLTCAYTVQHMTSKFVYMIVMWMIDRQIAFSTSTPLVLLAVANVVVCVPIYLSFTRRYLRDGALTFNRVQTVVLLALFLAAAIFLSWVLEDSLLTSSTNYLTSYLCLNALCILLAATVLSLELTNCSVKRLEGENDVLERLLEEDRMQYERAQRDMEKINIRYHDLKQQYAHALAEEKAELEAEMSELRPRYCTGDKALDVVLTQKSEACEKDDVQLVCSVDGELLRGMRSYHVYSLFGNALDNAIECLSAVSDRSRRVVWLNVERVGEMVVVRVENYTPAEPVVRDGSLVTTKADSESHGYGMKSIRSVAEAYGGSAEFFVEDHLFCLVVTIPTAELAAREQHEVAA